MNRDVLVLGNDPYINKIDFSRLDPNLITVGVNRIWLKFNPTYLFFHDVEILKELEADQERLHDLLANTEVIASDWLNIRAFKQGIQIPKWVKVYHRPNRTKFVDSVSTSIEIMERHVIRRKMNYYIAGVSLSWSNPSHFWKEDQDRAFLNSNGKDWYLPRFNRTLNNFKDLKESGYNLVSCTPGSKLNKLMRYESIGKFYIKQN